MFISTTPVLACETGDDFLRCRHMAAAGLIRNTPGGVSLVSALNHAPVIAGAPKAARISRI
jgi:hypothetical protein